MSSRRAVADGCDEAPHLLDRMVGEAAGFVPDLVEERSSVSSGFTVDGVLIAGTVLYRRPNLQGTGSATPVRSSRISRCGSPSSSTSPDADEAGLLEGAPGAAVPLFDGRDAGARPGPREDDLGGEPGKHARPEAAPDQLLLADQEVDPGDAFFRPDDRSPLGVVGHEVRLDHADRPAVELDQVVVASARVPRSTAGSGPRPPRTSRGRATSA